MQLTPPADWATVPPEILSAAKATVTEALKTAALDRYYDLDGDFAGATFGSVAPNSPTDLTGADLHAVSMLSINIKPAATRRLLDESPQRSKLFELLNQVPADVALTDADPPALQAGWDFYCACRYVLADPNAAHSDPWVTATKLAARKRPLLIPVRDNVVRKALGYEPFRNGQIDWQLIGAIAASPEIVAAIQVALRDAQLRGTNRRLRFDTNPLRVIDAATWMHAMGYTKS